MGVIRRAGAALVPWLCLAAAGCEETEPLRRRVEDLLQQRLEVERERVGEVSDVRAQAPEEERARIKVTLYEACLRISSGPVQDHRERYEEALRRFFSGRDDTPPKIDIVTDADLNPCEKAVVDGLGMPPALPELDRAFQNYVHDVRVYAQYVRQAAQYLDTRAYLQDGGDEGRRIAEAVDGAYRNWFESRTKLVPLLQPRALAVARHRAENLPGTDLERAITMLVVEARGLAVCARSQIDTRRFACGASLEAFTSAHVAFERQFEMAPEGDEAVFWLGSFARTAAEIAELAQALSPLPRGRQRALRTDQLEALVERLRRDESMLWFRRGDG